MRNTKHILEIKPVSLKSLVCWNETKIKVWKTQRNYQR